MVMKMAVVGIRVIAVFSPGKEKVLRLFFFAWLTALI
jgi:hypothetical protein